VLITGGALTLGATAMASATTTVPGPAQATPDYQSACSAPAPGHASCLALVRTNIKKEKANALAADSAPAGYGPTSLQSAYDLAAAAAASGSGETVAVVDAYNDPNANGDLSAYRAEYGLPTCNEANGCLTVVSQTGSTTALPENAPVVAGQLDWTYEESLDVDMVSATCPNCHIDLVEASSTSMSDLGTAVNEAVALGAKFVSNSYGGSEASDETSYDSYYNHPGVVVTASAGDGGYGVLYPAASPYVTSVGGTSLSTASNARGWTESVWSNSATKGTGSGCSAYEPQPSWQTALNLPTGCGKRIVADVSAVADPNTGVAIYDTYSSDGGWNELGGTSAASPIIASTYALADDVASGSNPAEYPYEHRSDLNDVTSGSTSTCTPAYLCTAETGYDGPTGLGTPDGTGAFEAASSGTGANTVTVTNPGSQTTTVGTAVSLQAKGTDSASGQTLTYTAGGLPAGLSISSSGLISGTPTTAGTSNITVTAADTTGATGSATFTWTVNTASTGGGTVTVSNPGNLDWFTGYAYYGHQVSATDSKGLALTYSATGLPPGLSISPTGEISGTPTQAGTFSVKVTATDAGGSQSSASFSFTIYEI
jgi:subtilase family serine protease